MKKQALILQGWYQKPNSNWYPWLKKELEKRGYKVFLPDLPTMHTDLPDMKKQHVKYIYCISSDNDPYTTTNDAKAMNKRLTGKFILIKDAGHFTEKDGITTIPQLLSHL